MLLLGLCAVEFDIAIWLSIESIFYTYLLTYMPTLCVVKLHFNLIACSFSA